MATDFKDLLSKIECGEISPTGFTQDDLDKVKACLPEAQSLTGEDLPAEPTFGESCLPDAIAQAETIIKSSQEKIKKTNEISVVRGRVDEVLRNLEILQTYFAERLRYFLEVSSTVNPITAELLFIQSELAAASSASLQQRKEFLRKELGQKSKDLLQIYQPIPTSASAKTAYVNELATRFKVVSGKITPTLTDNSVTTFTLRFKDLSSANIVTSEGNQTVAIRTSSLLSNINVLSDMGSHVKLTEASQSQNDVDINSKLYDGAEGYRGLYRTLRAPIQNLYSPEERGLSINPDEVDPLLTTNPDLPKTLSEDGVTYFIKSIDKYDGFYKTLGETMPPRIEIEKTQNYPSQIQLNIDQIQRLARREAAHHLRTGSILTTLSQDTVFGQKTYEAGENSLTLTLKVYLESARFVDTRISQLKTEISLLDERINESVNEVADAEKRISEIPCFANRVGNAGDCEEKLETLRGTDPFNIRTMNGTNAGLPDPTTPCYWKYFAQELTLMGLLPIPDLINPLFRYYPVNTLIPAFPGPIVLTLPQKWKVLSVISTPFGTIVPMLAAPVTFPSPFPIPIPSIFVFYLAPDGNKYIILAPNIPFLIQPGQAQIGFQFDSTATGPSGLTGPYSGLPIKGAFTLPLSISATDSRNARIAKLLADLAQGKTPQVTMPNGKTAPGDKGELGQSQLDELKFGDEFGLQAVETTPEQDFKRLVTKIRMTINKQIDSFDDFATNSVQNIKDNIRESRSRKHAEASAEEDSGKRRRGKTLARAFDPINLETKINALIEESNKLIDSLNLGEIIYPDDPSKLNPHASSAITSIVDLIEMAGRGELKTERDSDLVKKARRIAKKFNARKHTARERFNLEDENDFIEVKRVLQSLADDVVGYLQGKPKEVDTSEARNEADAKGMTESDKEFQDLLVKTLSFTAIAFAVPPQISTFDPNKPCCEIESKSLFDGVPPETLAILSIFSSLAAALIQNLTVEDIKSLLNLNNVKNFGVDLIKLLFDSLISSLPPIRIPKTFNAASLIGSIIVPILSAISLPEFPLSGKPILPFQIRIPLDAIIKPLLKLALGALIQAILRLMADLIKKVQDSEVFEDIISQLDCGAFGVVTIRRVRSNQVEITLPNGKKLKLPIFPDIPLDLLTFFGFLMTSDVISFLKSLINAALDSILDPISAIVEPILSLIPNGSWSSLTLLDLASPISAVIKQIKNALEDSISKGNRINILNTDAYPILLAAALPLLEALESTLLEVAYIGNALLCSTGGAGVTIARLAHPIFNQDDLPPWERLTRKNPLFAIFLDEILYKSTTMSLGTLIFGTKLPGMYGVSTFRTMIIPPPRF